jgi:hypothetical protein
VRPPLSWFIRESVGVVLIAAFGVGPLIAAGARASRQEEWVAFAAGAVAGFAGSLAYLYSLWRRGSLRMFDTEKVAQRRREMRSRLPAFVALGVAASAAVAAVSSGLTTAGIAAFGAMMTVFAIHFLEHFIRHWRKIYAVGRAMKGSETG